jgi:hypothetical protein
MLDKGRAAIAGTSGEYHFNCPMDQHFLNFAGIDADKLKEQLAAGKGDGAILEWIEANAQHKRGPIEVHAWSVFHENRAPADVDSRMYLNNIHTQAGKHREDITTWFDVLDLDDYVTFGGKA